MTLNPMRAPIAAFYFILGLLTTWMVVWIADLLMVAFDSSNLFDYNTVKPVVWTMVIILGVLMTLGYSFWQLFDTEESS